MSAPTFANAVEALRWALRRIEPENRGDYFAAAETALHAAETGCAPKTLRDEFAMRAMQAQVATDMVPGEACDALVSAAAQAGQDPVYRLALASYEIADAMLKARAA